MEISEVIYRLEKIADFLNKRINEKVDFTKYQCRGYLAYDYNTNSIVQLNKSDYFKTGGVIYCLSKDFKKVAIDKIGEENLIKYLKG